MDREVPFQTDTSYPPVYCKSRLTGREEGRKGTGKKEERKEGEKMQGMTEGN